MVRLSVIVPACPRFNHSKAMCDKCLAQQHALIIGKRGKASSTDMYDAVVFREDFRRVGMVHILSEVTSRRPPKVGPNWRTSYRLKCAGLVGVVQLDASNDALPAERELRLAEIVPVKHGDQTNDFHCRNKGQMAIRLLTAADLGSSVQVSLAPLEAGTRVAVIDMRMFVPEVVSVLSTCCHHELAKMLQGIPFIGQLIGHPLTASDSTVQSHLEQQRRQVPQPESEYVDNLVTQKHAVRMTSDITKAVFTSNIEILQRLPSDARHKVSRQISRLVQQAGLCGAQLSAFLAAINCSLHCTQGPPGTGKSYIGVYLIKALDIVKCVAKEYNQGLSVGPILILSYKNHALDEILIDSLLLHKYREGELIRCGNPEDDRLRGYMEKRSKFELGHQKELAHRLSVLRRAQREAARMVDAATCLEIVGLDDTTHGRVSTCVDSVVRALVLLCAVDTPGDKAGESSSPSRIIRARGGREAYNILASIQQTNMQEASFCYEIIHSLHKDASHWKTAQSTANIQHHPPRIQRIYFIVQSWLQGLIPPPRCRTKDCMFAASHDVPFCAELHACLAANCKSERSPINDCKYCEEHRCAYEGDQVCVHMRKAPHHFCSQHVCSHCITFSVFPVQQICPQTFGCTVHKCASEGCIRLSLWPELRFCDEHCCHACADSPEVVQSLAHEPNSKYCINHKCAELDCCNRRGNCFRFCYCRQHTCAEDQCANKVEQPSHFCVKHRCAHDGICTAARWCDDRGRPSLFCHDHTCQFCVQQGEIRSFCEPVLDEAPRNTCAAHMMCNFIHRNGMQCNELAKMDDLYCLKHSQQSGEQVQMTCSGITTKRRSCRATQKVFADEVVHGKWYCPAHRDQASESDSDIDDSSTSSDNEDEAMEHVPPEPTISTLSNVPEYIPVKRCSGLNSKGLQCGEMCRRPAGQVHHPWYCAAHSDQENTPTAATQNRNPTIHTKVAIAVTNRSLRCKSKSQKGDVQVSAHIARGPDGTRGFHDQKRPRRHQPMTSSDSKSGVESPPDFLDAEVQDLDEMDFEGSDEEMPEDQQRLHDMLGSSSDDETQTSDDDTEMEQAQPKSDLESQAGAWQIDIRALCAMIRDWSWGMRIKERHVRVSQLLKQTSIIIAELRIDAEKHVESARRDRAQASANALKRARVIGATVAGASIRSKALHAAEPFAVIVEEACEVMEPLLMSTISFRSLKKLELIGDHRQLPAFVQSCWYNVQNTHRSIKTSLFERLVTTRIAAVTLHVLDEQRRMRPAIANLTRGAYADLVKINDHVRTIHQRVGDRYLDSHKTAAGITHAFKSQRCLWAGKGALVPGVVPQIFFWDVPGNKEGRPVAGLSACNFVEAKAAASLVKWFLCCGVPPSAISGSHHTKDKRGLS